MFKTISSIEDTRISIQKEVERLVLLGGLERANES